MVRVCRLNENGTAMVLHIRQSACSGDCHKCAGCGAVQEKLLISVQNPIGAQVGDMVKISANSGTVLLSAAILYIMPLLLFFGGYLLGLQFDLMKELLGGVAFVLGIGIAVLFDRFVLKKKTSIYSITGFVKC